MGLDAKFRTVNSFDAETPLDRQLSQLETNAAAGFKSLALQALPRFAPTNTKTANYVAQVDELVTMDSSGGNLTLTLPVASPQNAGRVIACARPSASNAVTARCVSGQINRAATYTVAAAVGLTLFLSDGSGWWANA